MRPLRDPQGATVYFHDMDANIVMIKRLLIVSLIMQSFLGMVLAASYAKGTGHVILL